MNNIKNISNENENIKLKEQLTPLSWGEINFLCVDKCSIKVIDSTSTVAKSLIIPNLFSFQ